MDFTYIASGQVTVTGCNQVILKKKYSFNFAIGSKVYSLAKAMIGILEVVYVKKVLIRRNKFNQRVILYVDTLNGMWNEYDLCDHATALSIAINYLEGLQEEGREAVRIICNHQRCVSHKPNDGDEDDVIFI